MPKTSRQKARILYLMRFFMEKTDENHPAGVPAILEYLDGCGMTAERKSVYDDIEALRQFGFDLELKRGRKGGYYMASREFQLPELKLLVDSVQASRFITHKKSLELISKLEKLASDYDAHELQHQVYVTGRIKSMNESIYYGVDELHRAIALDRELSFRYSEYAVNKERVYRRGGARYVVSPFALTMSDGNYYLLAYEEGKGMRHFRVDRMTDLRLSDAHRRGKEYFKDLDMGEQSQRVFGMFSGEEMTVTMRFRNHLAGAVIDRFGKDVPMLALEKERFEVVTPVVVSPQFFGWLCGFGSEVELMGPQSAREAFREYLAGITAQYGE